MVHDWAAADCSGTPAVADILAVLQGLAVGVRVAEADPGQCADVVAAAPAHPPSTPRRNSLVPRAALVTGCAAPYRFGVVERSVEVEHWNRRESCKERCPSPGVGIQSAVKGAVEVGRRRKHPGRVLEPGGQEYAIEVLGTRLDTEGVAVVGMVEESEKMVLAVDLGSPSWEAGRPVCKTVAPVAGSLGVAGLRRHSHAAAVPVDHIAGRTGP